MKKPGNELAEYSMLIAVGITISVLYMVFVLELFKHM